EVVGPSSAVARHDADDGAEHDGHDRGAGGDHERDPEAEEQLGEDVSSSPPLHAKWMRPADAAPSPERLAAQVADQLGVERVWADADHAGNHRAKDGDEIEE